MSRLRIALIAPPWFSVPPTGYGGVEWIVSSLADGLVRRGHRVTLFASGGSQTSAELVSTYAEPPSSQLGDWMVEAPAVAAAYARANEFDIIHDHSVLGTLCAAGAGTPVVHTVHGKVSPELARLYAALSQRVRFIAISEDQRSSLPEGVQASVIHNGINTELYPFEPQTGEYLLFVGRVNPDKGIMDAVEIAQRTGKRLVVFAKINEANEREYFETVVKPALCGARVDFFEHATHAQKAQAYRGALATLFPIHWREPFGLVMTESMASGTPVIAYRAGSVPEVIVDGQTGFICDDVEDAVQAVGRVHSLSRKDCAERVATHFSAELMVEKHERLYTELTSRALATVFTAERGTMVAAAG